MKFVVDIEDASVPGITAAREAYNASLPATVKDGEDDAPNPALLAKDGDYVSMVLQRAVESWNKQYAPTPDAALVIRMTSVLKTEVATLAAVHGEVVSPDLKGEALLAEHARLKAVSAAKPK